MTYPRLVLRNLLRHPLRTLLTTLSIALSIFLVCAVLTLPSALDAILDARGVERAHLRPPQGRPHLLAAGVVRAEGAAPARASSA